jgi:hypothetical protein
MRSEATQHSLNLCSETNSSGTLAVSIQPSLYLLAGDGDWGDGDCPLPINAYLGRVVAHRKPYWKLIVLPSFSVMV